MPIQINYEKNLDPEKSIIDNIAQGRETIEIGGQKQHFMGYLGNFLFTPQRARTPVKALSGGEQNRVVLADLFSRPTNLLVLDEPTNDLDIETLELLEELLINYQGTLLIVSHDREFLNNVVTSVYVFEGQGKITEYIGGYNDWHQQAQRKTVAKTISAPTPQTHQTHEAPKNSGKLSYKDQRELSGIPNQIEKLEKEQQELSELISSEKFYQQSSDKVTETMNKMKSIEEKIQALYARWEELGG